MKRALWQSFSIPGLLMGALFFAASLTPSLLPRTYVTQGLVSRLSLAAGYCIGASVQWLWTYLEIPRLRGPVGRAVGIAAAFACAGVVAVALAKAAGWQDSVRGLMGLPPVEPIYPLGATLIAPLVLAVLLVLARLFRLAFRFVAAVAQRFGLPRT